MDVGESEEAMAFELSGRGGQPHGGQGAMPGGCFTSEKRRVPAKAHLGSHQHPEKGIPASPRYSRQPQVFPDNKTKFKYLMILLVSLTVAKERKLLNLYGF